MVPVIKLHRNRPLTGLILSPWAIYMAHWWNRRSYFCPGTNCEICKAWPARARRAAIIKIGGQEPGLIELPNSEIGQQGEIVTITRTKREVNVEVTGNVKLAPQKAKSLDDAWRVLADLLQLPWPDEDRFTTDTLKRWEKMATKRISMSLQEGHK